VNNILILFAHPRFEKSRANRALLKNIGHLTGVTLHDLYEEYPDFNIDVEREKALLLDHQAIVWHHPFFSYGVPALLKQWIDLVLEYGWAHGEGGEYLRGKTIFNVLTAGGTREVYAPGGHNGYVIREFLRPFEQTARLCNMIYLPPFVVHGTYLLTDQEMDAYGRLYLFLLERLAREESTPEALQQYEYMNDWLLAQNGSVTK
jgi:glutathione-regulated potassium-efflux system ancillary protein KefG